jgi:site-specific recombinase XerD
VLRYRFFLDQKNLAPSTINVRLAAVRRLADEGSDSGLLSPELAAGIRRVKGAKRLGTRIGNWLTADQCRSLLRASCPDTLRGKRDRAILAVLIGCGLRRAELVGLQVDDLQICKAHWVVDLIGKGKHVRTVPMPNWVKCAVDGWTQAAGITTNFIFRAVNRTGAIWGEHITPKAIWHVVKGAARRAGIANLAPHDLRRSCARLCHLAGGELEQIQFLLGHVSVQTTERLSRLQAKTAERSERRHRRGGGVTSEPRVPQGDFARQFPGRRVFRRTAVAPHALRWHDRRVDRFRLPEALECSQTVLIAGAGGGFDVYAGLPIYHRLRSIGKQAYLANLPFTY